MDCSIEMFVIISMSIKEDSACTVDELFKQTARYLTFSIV